MLLQIIGGLKPPQPPRFRRAWWLADDHCHSPHSDTLLSNGSHSDIVCWLLYSLVSHFSIRAHPCPKSPGVLFIPCVRNYLIVFSHHWTHLSPISFFPSTCFPITLFSDVPSSLPTLALRSPIKINDPCGLRCFLYFQDLPKIHQVLLCIDHYHWYAERTPV